MKKQIKLNWQTIAFAAIAIVFTFGTAVAQGEKSISERYGSREPRTCEDTKAPAKGAITAALALKYLNCQMENVSGSGDLYMVENVKVEVGGGIPYAAIRGQYSLNQIDVRFPVYPIRGSFLKYQCQAPRLRMSSAQHELHNLQQSQSDGLLLHNNLRRLEMQYGGQKQYRERKCSHESRAAEAVNRGVHKARRTNQRHAVNSRKTSSGRG